jgi:hypothetical protein
MALMTDRRSEPRSISYQDTLRAVGAWLDVRGYRDVRIVESDGELVIEARLGKLAGATTPEVLTFDHAGVLRLQQAARSDRGAPHLPLSLVPAPRIMPLCVRSGKD